MSVSKPTKRQMNQLNKIFGKLRIEDSVIIRNLDILLISLPCGRKDKLRITSTGMFLGHWQKCLKNTKPPEPIKERAV